MELSLLTCWRSPPLTPSNHQGLILVMPKNPISYLIGRRFPGLITDRLGNVVDPSPSRNRSQEEIDQRRHAIEIYRAELSGLTDEALVRRVEKEQKKEAAEFDEKRKSAEAGIFYSKPEATADFGYWAMMPSWTLDEAVALSLGKSPAVVRWENVSPLVSSSYRLPAEYARRLDLAEAWKEAGKITDPVPTRA